MFTVLETLRDALGNITGVKSCKIGIERNMSPADYPMVAPNYAAQRRQLAVQIGLGRTGGRGKARAKR